MRFFALGVCCALSLSALSMTSAWSASLIDRLEASVNGSLILRSDIARFKKTVGLRSQIDPLFASTAVGRKADHATDSEVIDYLIDDRLILSLFPVSDAETEQAIQQVQSDARLSRSGLKTAIQDQGFRFEDYFELIRLSVSKKNLIESDIRTKVSVSDDDVKNYYYNHFSKGSKAPKTFSFRMLSVSGSDYKTPAAAKDLMDRARKELLAGEPFEEVAARVSGSSASSDVSRVSEDQASPTIRSALSQLKIGEVSPVLGNATETLFLVKLLDISLDNQERFEKMKEEIRNQLASGEYQRQIVLWLERQRQSAYIRKAGASQE